MKRLLLAITACGLLACVGLESLHRHQTAARESCALCVLGAQTVRHVPDALPAPVSSATWQSLPQTASVGTASPFARQASARSPPSA